MVYRGFPRLTRSSFEPGCTGRVTAPSSRRPSRNEPATNTIVAGLVLVAAFYAAQVSLVGWLLNWIAAIVYSVSLPLSASWDFRYADRLRRGAVRVRTYLRFRRDPAIHRQLLNDLTWLRAEARELDSVLEAPDMQHHHMTQAL